jgi:hypothetical protein
VAERKLRPAVVRCHLCLAPDDGQIVTVRGRAWWAAMDHALEHHLDQLIANPRASQNSFTITTTGPPRALRPGDPTTRS